MALAASFTIDPNPRRRARNNFPRFEDNVRVLRGAYLTPRRAERLRCASRRLEDR